MYAGAGLYIEQQNCGWFSQALQMFLMNTSTGSLLGIIAGLPHSIDVHLEQVYIPAN